jgi:hypothetical protein
LFIGFQIAADDGTSLAMHALANKLWKQTSQARLHPLIELCPTRHLRSGRVLNFFFLNETSRIAA